MTVLFCIFDTALINLDWPFSPHRSTVSAWVNHALLLLLLAFMMALLCTVLDASKRMRDYFTHLDPRTPPMPPGEEPAGQGCWTQYPIDEDTLRLWTRFRFAVRLTSSVNRFIYLPLIPLLLVLPTRSRVFDAWDIPLPYIALLGMSVLLAVGGALSLRHAAADLKTQILAQLDSQTEDLKLTQYSQARKTEATPAPDADPERRDVPSGEAIATAWAGFLSAGQDDKGTPAPDDSPPQSKAYWLRRIADENPLSTGGTIPAVGPGARRARDSHCVRLGGWPFHHRVPVPEMTLSALGQMSRSGESDAVSLILGHTITLARRVTSKLCEPDPRHRCLCREAPRA